MFGWRATRREPEQQLQTDNSGDCTDNSSDCTDNSSDCTDSSTVSGTNSSAVPVTVAAPIDSCVDKDKKSHSAHKQILQIDELPAEVRAQVLAQLPTRDRLASAQLSRDWQRLVKTKAAWKQCTGLLIIFRTRPGPKFNPLDRPWDKRDTAGSIRFQLYDPLVSPQGPQLDWEQLDRVWPLLPPTSQLHIRESISDDCPTHRFPSKTVDRVRDLVHDMRLSELTAWDQKGQFTKLCDQLMLQGSASLRSVQLSHMRLDSLLAADKCTQLEKLKITIYHEEDYEPPEDERQEQGPKTLHTTTALKLIASKWAQLSWLKVRFLLFDERGDRFTHSCLADLLNTFIAGSSNPGLSVHLTLVLCYCDTGITHDCDVLPRLFNPDATALIAPIANIKSLSVKACCVFVPVTPHTDTPLHVRTQWLQGLLHKWCPYLQQLAVHAFGPMQMVDAANLVQYVLELVIKRNSEHPFQLMFPLHYSEMEDVHHRELMVLLLHTYNGQGYSCTHKSLPTEQQQPFKVRAICTWQLTISEDPPTSGPRLIVCGRQ